jgi:hypothetical protein
MAISSQFYKDLSKVEEKLMGVNPRQLKAYGLFFVEVVVLVAEVFLLPDWAYLWVTLPTAVILSIYPLGLLMNQWKQWRRNVELNFIYEDRFYRVGQIRRYAKNEFTQAKTVRETDTLDTLFAKESEENKTTETN